MMSNLRIIFDGNNTCYRANCVTELYTSDGRRTSAILGVLNITQSTMVELEKLVGKEISDVIYVFDKGHSERRKSIFPGYKAKKEKSDDDKTWITEFITQANSLFENLPSFGVKTLKKSGWEADDLVFAIVSQLEELKVPDDVVIVSTDEDFHQLISETVSVYSPIKKVLFTKENYLDKTGIPQELFLTYKILRGDSSDKIPGIDGIGEKTSKALVNTYGDISGILRNREELSKSARTKKIFTPEGLQTLKRNNQLINLKDFVDVSEVKKDVVDLIKSESIVDTIACREYLREFQLSSILSKFKPFIEVFEDMSENL